MKMFSGEYFKILAVLILGTLLALGSGGCGKKGPPAPKYPFGNYGTADTR